MKHINSTKIKILIFCTIYLLILYLALINTFGTNAKPFHRTFEGLEYRNSTEMVEAKIMTLDGMFSNPIVGRSRFRGELTYNNRDYTVDFYIKEDDHISIVDEDNYTGPNSDLGYLLIKI